MAAASATVAAATIDLTSSSQADFLPTQEEEEETPSLLLGSFQCQVRAFRYELPASYHNCFARFSTLFMNE